jgi:hypothetical protein
MEDMPQERGPAPANAVQTNLAPTPTQVYLGLVNQREELTGQLRTLANRRSSLVNQLPSARYEVERKGIEQRIVTIDEQIREVDKQLADVYAQITRASSVPGVVIPTPPPIPRRTEPPDAVFILPIVFGFILLIPVSIAVTRRIWRRTTGAIASLPRELMDRLTRLEESVESVAIEVERVGEGQRFVTNLFAQLPDVLHEARLPSNEGRGEK